MRRGGDLQPSAGRGTGNATLNPIAERAQTRYSTKLDRYPRIFAEVARHARELAGGGGVRVLSFGCSRGDECASLADLYFTQPDDFVCGIDINARAVARARLRNRRANIRYLASKEKEAATIGEFHAIFAMSVLCLHDRDGDLAQSFPFSSFCEIVAELDRKLAPGGVLAIFNASYRFADTPTARGYVTVPVRRQEREFVPKHAPSGAVLPFERFVLFRKFGQG